MAEGRNLIAIRHGSNLSQAFEDGKRPIENFELGFDTNNGVLYIGVNDTYQAVGANFGKDVVLTAENGGTGQKIIPEEGKIVFSYFDQNGGQIIETSASGTLYTIKEEDENGNSSITVMHGILPPAAGGTGLSEILPNSFIYGGADGNLVSIAPGQNTAGDIGFNAGVPIFEVDNVGANKVKTGIVPLEFGGLGENSENFELGLLYLTNTTVEDDVAKRVFRTVANPTLVNPNSSAYLTFNGESPEWTEPPFVQKSDSAEDGELMIYSGPDGSKDYFTTISGSGFLYSDDSGFNFQPISTSNISDLETKLSDYVSGALDGYVTSDKLKEYQPIIDATGILVRTGESITGVSGDIDNTYLSYNGGSYSFTSIEAGPTISGTGLLYAVQEQSPDGDQTTPDKVTISGKAFPTDNSIVFIEKDDNNNMGIAYHSTLPLSYYDIPLKAADASAIGNGEVWGILWSKYNKKGNLVDLKELSSWMPQDGTVTKFFGLGIDNNFYYSSSLPTTTEVLPSNLKYSTDSTLTLKNVIGLGTDTNEVEHFMKVDPSTFGKTYTEGFGISIEEGAISVDINSNRGPGVLWYWGNALESYPINDKNDKTFNLYLAAYDENKYMYRYNTGDGIVTLENGIITLVSKEDIGGSDINIGSGSGYLWKDEQKGTISPTTYISSVTIGQNGYGTTFDAKYITLDGVGTAGSSSKLLFMNNSGNIVSSSETIENMPTITLPGSNELGGWVWMDEDGDLKSYPIIDLAQGSTALSGKGLLFTNNQDDLLQFCGTGTAGYLYTDASGNISISTPSSGGLTSVSVINLNGISSNPVSQRMVVAKSDGTFTLQTIPSGGGTVTKTTALDNNYNNSYSGWDDLYLVVADSSGVLYKVTSNAGTSHSNGTKYGWLGIQGGKVAVSPG